MTLSRLSGVCFQGVKSRTHESSRTSQLRGVNWDLRISGPPLKLIGRDKWQSVPVLCEICFVLNVLFVFLAHFRFFASFNIIMRSSMLILNWDYLQLIFIFSEKNFNVEKFSVLFHDIKFSDNLDCDVRRGVKLYTSISNLCIALVNKKYLFFSPCPMDFALLGTASGFTLNEKKKHALAP